MPPSTATPSSSVTGTGTAAVEVVEVELAKGLGLTEALTIGIGTMIGAGIFVLPGFIIAKAGPAAVLSFFLGGCVALFCAMSAAEVATGMPMSGGGYYFISRALGPLFGALIGWGSWFGLVFASAFYMVGFGAYVATFVPLPVWALAVGMTLVLVALNLIGSTVAGRAQNAIVAVLVGALALFVGRGLFSVNVGLITHDFMPFGMGAVVGGTATLFVTYCGFGEIASMAEEIRNPGVNLPKALLGSVISVTALYCLVLLICVGLRPHGELGSSTLVADLAQDLLGAAGRGVVLLGAVMATVSSANASIMSASRISFAMGRDSLIWEWLNQIHPRFRVPHRAILVTGALTVAVVLLGGIEFLAEAAGLLHLLLYGLICVACIILRGARVAAYRPTYKVPLFPVIPLLGAGGCLAVAAFMGKTTFAAGVGIVVFAVGHYYAWGRRRTTLRGAWPHFLRRAVLEPALVWAERWGATPEEPPTALVAAGRPERERARLALAAAMMGPAKGRLLAVNVFTVRGAVGATDDLLTSYRETLAARTRALEKATAAVVPPGVRVTSHVPIAVSVFYGLLSAAETSRTALSVVGWPEPRLNSADPVPLLNALDNHLRSHLFVLREQSPVPARRLLVVPGSDPSGELALLTAARLSEAWNAHVTVAAVVAPGTSERVVAKLEADLEARAGEVTKADVAVLPAESLDHLDEEVGRHDLLLVGVPLRPSSRLNALVAELGGITGTSVLLVKAHPDQPLDLWR